MKHVKLRQYAETIKDFDEAIRLNPTDADTYSRRGRAKASLKQYAEAIKDFDLIIGEFARFRQIEVRAYNARGVCKTKLGKRAAAISDYSVAIQRKPDYTGAYYN